MSFYNLFYSNKCRYCSDFIKLLEHCGQSKNFHAICVDKNERGERPFLIKKYCITEVPTIIIDNKKLVGYDTLMWLRGISNTSAATAERGSMPTRLNKNTDRINRGAGTGAGGELESYNFNSGSQLHGNITDNCVELGVSSDFIPDDTAEFGIEIDDSSHFKLPTETITGIEFLSDKRTMPESIAKRDKLKEKQFDNEFNKMMRERDRF